MRLSTQGRTLALVFSSAMTSYINCSQATTQYPVTATIYGYAPSLPANAILLSIFSLVAVVQLMQGTVWKTWRFMTVITLGSFCEIAGECAFCPSSKLCRLIIETGYIGRLELRSNPWSLNASVGCLTTVRAISQDLYH